MNGVANSTFSIYNYGRGTIPFSIVGSSGNVGIGTTSPSALLHVAGNLTVDGTITGTSAMTGTTSNAFTLNSDNASNDAEDSYLEFSRGSAGSHARITWNSASDHLNVNYPLNVNNKFIVDTNGNIQYSGNLKNQSPTKIEDGIDVVNFGGIKGGQIAGLPKDVIIGLSDNLRIAEHKLIVPQAKFLRFSAARPKVETKKEVVRVSQSGALQARISLARNEKLISVDRVILVSDPRRKISAGFTFKDAGIIEFSRPVAKGSYEITFTSRTDLVQPQVIDFTIDAQQIALASGAWQIVYLKEEPLSTIGSHDTAAMAERTKVSIGVCKAEDFAYGADTYVIALVTPDERINQYIKVE